MLIHFIHYISLFISLNIVNSIDSAGTGVITLLSGHALGPTCGSPYNLIEAVNAITIF